MRRHVILGFIQGVTLMLAGILANAASPPVSVFFNEIHYDNVGTDTGEFIEIAGSAGTDLSAYSIVLYNGVTGAPYSETFLSGLIPDQMNGMGTLQFTYPTNGIQNGSPDGFALSSGGAVIQFLSYEGSFAAVSGVANGLISTDIGVVEDGTSPIGYSLQLQGTGRIYSDFAWAGPIAGTPGAINTGQTFAPAIPVPEPEIYAMMGVGLGFMGWVGRRRRQMATA